MSRPTWYCDDNKRQANDFKKYLDARSICFRNTSRNTHPFLARGYCENQTCFDREDECVDDMKKIINKNPDIFLDDSKDICKDDDDKSDEEVLEEMRKRTRNAEYDEEEFILGKKNMKKRGRRKKKSMRGGRRKTKKRKSRKSRRKRRKSCKKRKKSRRRRRR